MSSGRRGGTTRHTTYNLLGYALPLGVAFVALPPTIRALGPELYGLFVLVMLAHDYLGYFDFGLGRAATKLLAEVVNDPARRASARDVFRTSLILHAALGLALGAAFALAVPLIVHYALPAGSTIGDEARRTLYSAATLGPILLVLIVTRGSLESLSRFDVINAVKIPSNALTYLIPWYGAVGGWPLYWIVLGIALMRLLTAAAYLWAILRFLPEGHSEKFDGTLVRPLLSFGGHIMLASLAGMLLVDGDRFLVSHLLGPGSLTYYSVPQDLVTRAWIFPASLASALFPRFASTFSVDRELTGKLYRNSLRYSTVLLTPVAVAGALISGQFLTWWLSATFANEATRVLQIVALGVVIDSLTRIPLTFLQAVGSQATVTRVRWWSVPAMLVCSILALLHAGLVGAAAVWAGRMAVELLILSRAARRHFPPGWTDTAGLGFRVLFVVSVAVCILAFGADRFLAPTGYSRIVVALALIVGFWAFGWLKVTPAEHRALLRHRLAEQLRAWT